MRTILASIFVLACIGLQAGEPPQSSPDDVYKEIKDAVYAELDPLDMQGFKRKIASKPGDWLWMNREIPQTLPAYTMSAKVHATEKRKIIVLQPLGTLDTEQTQLVEALREYAGVFFQAPVRVEKPLPLGTGKIDDPLIRLKPAGNRNGRWDRQYDAEKILTDVLSPKLPEDALIYLGITMEDLYDGDLNFIFGLGSLQDRVGVYSMCRYYPEFWGRKRQPGDELQALRRSCKVLNHEAGHMFGMGHCVFFECSMNGSNSLQESDGRPLHYCPLCHQKILWNLKFEPLKRFEQLEQFYSKQKLAAEAAWIKTRAVNYKALLDKKKPLNE